jgi:hypothetical protein
MISTTVTLTIDANLDAEAERVVTRLAELDGITPAQALGRLLVDYPSAAHLSAWCRQAIIEAAHRLDPPADPWRTSA